LARGGFDISAAGTVPPAITAVLEAEAWEDAVRTTVCLGGGHSPTLPCFIASTHVLRDPGLDQLPHEGGRHSLVGLETDRALADVVILEFVPYPSY